MIQWYWAILGNIMRWILAAAAILLGSVSLAFFMSSKPTTSGDNGCHEVVTKLGGTTVSEAERAELREALRDCLRQGYVKYSDVGDLFLLP